MKDTLETSEVLFYAQANGDILRMDGGQVSPESFWASLPESTRLALAKAAPKVVTPWEHSKNHSWRNKESSLNPAADVYLTERGWRSVWRPEPFPTREEAMAFEDNVLRGKGYVLDG